MHRRYWALILVGPVVSELATKRERSAPAGQPVERLQLAFPMIVLTWVWLQLLLFWFLLRALLPKFSFLFLLLLQLLLLLQPLFAFLLQLKLQLLLLL